METIQKNGYEERVSSAVALKCACSYYAGCGAPELASLADVVDVALVFEKWLNKGASA